jgi:segregation and condensation protein A
MAMTLHLSQFEGPLDMLLFLIGKAKIDIREIFISEITDQYVKSVQNAPDLDMDDASGFVSMAATLLEIKSRTLLPAPLKADEEEDPEQALIHRLEEYAAFKEIAQSMQDFEKAAAQYFSKLPEEYPLPPPTLEITGLTLSGLLEAFAHVIARIPKGAKEAPAESSRRIMRDEFTVSTCMDHILTRLKRGSVTFQILVSDDPSREEVVSLFLALLELLRIGKVTVTQDTIYGELLLSRI